MSAYRGCVGAGVRELPGGTTFCGNAKTSLQCLFYSEFSFIVIIIL